LGGDRYNQTLHDRVVYADPRYNMDRRRSSVAVALASSPAYRTDRLVEREDECALSALALSYETSRDTRGWLPAGTRLSLCLTDIFRISSVKEERGIDYPFACGSRFDIFPATSRSTPAGGCRG
ncbi:MAG: hypothetical protein LBI96_05870, partial [Odoribacteraceae bacterium]|nr:hypothetical protein [Odoribacteraceae bacterium]